MKQILESRIGKYFIIAYGLCTFAVYGYVFFCTGSVCASYIVIPILPWAYVIVQNLHLVFPSAMYPIFILVNASIFYIIGATIEWVYDRYLDFKEGKKLKVLQQKKNNFLKNNV